MMRKYDSLGVLKFFSEIRGVKFIWKKIRGLKIYSEKIRGLKILGSFEKKHSGWVFPIKNDRPLMRTHNASNCSIRRFNSKET